jgi:hypothetical protein
VAINSTEIRRQIERRMHQTRHPLFVTTTRGKAILLPIFGAPKYVSFVGRKTTLRHLARRINPLATSQTIFGGRKPRRLPQTNKKLRGTWRKERCQEVYIVVPRMFSTTTS